MYLTIFVCAVKADLNSVCKAQLSPSLLQPVGYHVDGFLHIWLAVVEMLQLTPSKCCLSLVRAGTACFR